MPWLLIQALVLNSRCWQCPSLSWTLQWGLMFACCEHLPEYPGVTHTNTLQFVDAEWTMFCNLGNSTPDPSPLQSMWQSLWPAGWWQCSTPHVGRLYISLRWLPSGGTLLPAGPGRDGGGGDRVYDTAGEWDTIEMAMGYTSLINCQVLIPSPYSYHNPFCFPGNTISWQSTLGHTSHRPAGYKERNFTYYRG